MRTITILFGGGDAGGILITDHGIEPIPPLEQPLRYQLRALSSLIHAERLLHRKESTRMMATLITELAGTVMTQLEAIVGVVDTDNGVIFQDDGGGFVCGLTGKQPIPLPWPVNRRAAA